MTIADTAPDVTEDQMGRPRANRKRRVRPAGPARSWPVFTLDRAMQLMADKVDPDEKLTALESLSGNVLVVGCGLDLDLYANGEVLTDDHALWLAAMMPDLAGPIHGYAEMRRSWQAENRFRRCPHTPAPTG